MDNKFVQEFISLAGKYGYNMSYFSVNEDKEIVNLEVTLSNMWINRNEVERAAVSVYDNTGMSE